MISNTRVSRVHLADRCLTAVFSTFSAAVMFKYLCSEPLGKMKLFNISRNVATVFVAHMQQIHFLLVSLL